jgi:hypothetical protein
MKKRNFNWLIVLSMLFSCTTTNNITKPTNPTPVPTVVPTVLKTPEPTPSPSQPVQSPSDGPTGTPVPGPSVSPTASVSTIDISEKATLNGKVFDESGNPLNDIKVTVKSADENFNFQEETTTSNGSYVFRNIPVGVRLQVEVFKNEKWTKKAQPVVLKSNLSGVPDVNIVDFGDILNADDPNKKNFFFITDAPEVVSITPGRSSVIKNSGISFKLTFSEPVKKETVEKNFIMRYVATNISSTTTPGDGTLGTVNTDGPPALLRNNQVIIAKNTVPASFTWDENNVGEFGREVTFAIGQDRGIPTSPKSNVMYSISLREKASDVRLEDADGHNGLQVGEFFVDGKRTKNIVVFVQADKESPYIDSLKLLKTSSNCIIRVIFNEPMVLEYVDNPDIFDQSLYKFYKNGVPIVLANPVYRLANPNVMEILAPTNTFQTSDLIKVEIDQNMRDPVGNFFSLGVTNGDRDNIREERFKPD